MNASLKSKNIAVIGAGIAGLTSAIMLGKLGCKVRIFEAAEKVRGIGAGMGLASNAMKAFEYLGLEKEVMGISNHLTDFEISDAQGKIILAADTEKIKQNYNAENFAVHRADLHQLLVKKISSEKIQTDKRLSDLKVLEDRIEIKFEDGSCEEFDFLIGADGVNSRVRQFFLPKATPRYAGYWCWRGIVKASYENAHKGLETWGKMGRFGITPLTKNRIYWYACINSNLKDGIPQFDLNQLRNRFENYHEIISKLLEISNENDLVSNPIVDLKPISKYHFGRVLLIGDAAHATTPNMGQGACMAIEDVAVLQDEFLKNEWHTACENFEKRRLKRTEYIIKTSGIAGKVAQSENPILILFRNNLLRTLPDSLSQFPLKRLLEEDFMKT